VPKTLIKSKPEYCLSFYHIKFQHKNLKSIDFFMIVQQTVDGRIGMILVFVVSRADQVSISSTFLRVFFHTKFCRQSQNVTRKAAKT